MIRHALIDDASRRSSRKDYLMRAVKEGRLTSLYIEPASSCNLSCGFCPFHANQGGIVPRKGKGIMQMDLFSQVVEEVQRLPFRFDAIHFYQHGESLLNQNLPAMISLAKRHKLANVLKVVTNGTLMAPLLFDELVDSGVTSITVSLDTVSRTSFRQFKGRDLLPQVLRNTEYGIQKAERTGIEFVVKCTSAQGHSELESTEVDEVVNHFRMKAEASSNIHVEIRREFTWAVPHPTARRPPRALCDLPFYQLAIHYDGVVSPCCNDLTYDLAVGRIGDRSQTLREILLSEKLRQIRLALLQGKMEALGGCRFCTLKVASDLCDNKDELGLLFGPKGE